MISSKTIENTKKAKLYAEERDQRIRFRSFSVVIEGEHHRHTTSYSEGEWRCDCEFFKTHGHCSHTMAMERVLGPMIAEDAHVRDAIRRAIPDEVFELLQDVAPRMSMSIDELAAEWVKRFAEKPRPRLSDEERGKARAQFASHIGAANLGHPTGTDNEQIDSDLGREYASTHGDVS